MLNNTWYSVTLPAVHCGPFYLKSGIMSDIGGFQISGVDEANGKSSLFTTKKKNNNNNKKQSVNKQIVWAPCGHHGSVNQLNMKKIAVLSP